MTISLYDISVANYLQILGSIRKVLDKGAECASQHNIDLVKVVDTSLHPDMLPFSFQVNSVYHHSLGAINGLRDGVFSTPPPCA